MVKLLMDNHRNEIHNLREKLTSKLQTRNRNSTFLGDVPTLVSEEHFTFNTNVGSG
jgi:hypothetical protein